MTQPLYVVPPVTMTDAMLIATNVAETDYAAWSSGTTYALGNRVIRTSTHKVYESLQASNTNHTPESSPTWWVEVSSTNRWKLFDTSISSQTAQANSITYQIRPGMAISSVNALNVVGATAMRVRLIDPTYGTVYDTTVDLSDRPTTSDWWAWMFARRTPPTLAVLTDLPSYPSADLYVDFTGGSTLAVGVLLFGQARAVGLGVTQGARVGITDYSVKSTNAFGDTVITQRAFAKRASFSVPLKPNEVDVTLDYFAGIRSTPCLWIGSGSYASTVVYGFWKDFEIVIAYANVSECSLTLEGLT